MAVRDRPTGRIVRDPRARAHRLSHPEVYARQLAARRAHGHLQPAHRFIDPQVEAAAAEGSGRGQMRHHRGTMFQCPVDRAFVGDFQQTIALIIIQLTG